MSKHKVTSGEYDTYLNLGRSSGRKFSESILRNFSKNKILKEIERSLSPSEEFCIHILSEFTEYPTLSLVKKTKARQWFLEGWTSSLMKACDKYNLSRKSADEEEEGNNKKGLKFMKVSDGQFAFSDVVEASIQLARLGVSHTLVMATKQDALAELLSLNSSEADDECGESDSEFGNYVLFVFKPGKFAKFLERNKGDVKSKSLEKALEESVAKVKKTINVDDDFVAIIREQDEDAVVTVEYYETSKGKQVWKKIKDAWDEIEDEEDDEDYDPETDEIEDE